MGKRISIVPVTLKTADAFVVAHHRHHGEAGLGSQWAVGAAASGDLVGVAIVGRPRALALARDPFCAEVLRVCVREQAPCGACSCLLSACWRAWRAMGGHRLITYTLESESGASLRGAGWRPTHTTEPTTWNRPGAGRIRKIRPTDNTPKIRWEISRNGEPPEYPQMEFVAQRLKDHPQLHLFGGMK